MWAREKRKTRVVQKKECPKRTSLRRTENGSKGIAHKNGITRAVHEGPGSFVGVELIQKGEVGMGLGTRSLGKAWSPDSANGTFRKVDLAKNRGGEKNLLGT